MTVGSMKQDRSERIAILKIDLEKNEAGVWALHALKGIDLKPRQGFEADYFGLP